MSDPDEELIGAAQAGDPGAFSAVCERHRERLWRIAASVASCEDAEDLAQEACLRAFRSLASYRGEAPVAAWLCRIAVNLAHDYQRCAWQRRVTVTPWVGHDEGQAISPHGAAEQRELRRSVRQAVARLPRPQRVPIWLHYFEGFSISEVARLEGAPETTVRSRLKAGLRRLSISLESLLEPAPRPTPLDSQPRRCET